MPSRLIKYLKVSGNTSPPTIPPLNPMWWLVAIFDFHRPSSFPTVQLLFDLADIPRQKNHARYRLWSFLVLWQSLSPILPSPKSRHNDLPPSPIQAKWRQSAPTLSHENPSAKIYKSRFRG